MIDTKLRDALAESLGTELIDIGFALNVQQLRTVASRLLKSVPSEEELATKIASTVLKESTAQTVESREDTAERLRRTYEIETRRANKDPDTPDVDWEGWLAVADAALERK